MKPTSEARALSIVSEQLFQAGLTEFKPGLKETPRIVGERDQEDEAFTALCDIVQLAKANYIIGHPNWQVPIEDLETLDFAMAGTRVFVGREGVGVFCGFHEAQGLIAQAALRGEKKPRVYFVAEEVEAAREVITEAKRKRFWAPWNKFWGIKPTAGRVFPRLGSSGDTRIGGMEGEDGGGY